MKISKTARFSLLTLLAAATLGVGASRAQAATIDYTIDDLGDGRYVLDIYTPNDIGYGANKWVYGAQPVNTTLNVDFNNSTQSGSINS